MSALSSGFEGAENFYRVVPPVPGDLREPFIGACYRQKADICWFPDRGTTIWIVTKIQEDIITIQPNTGESNRPRWQRPLRRLPASVLRTEYRPCLNQRQYPPC
jgi:hypothetical protein